MVRLTMEPLECDAFYHTYTSQVPADRDVIEVLADGVPRLRQVLADVSESDERFRYAPGKWTVRELVGHMLDTERLFGFRALWFARADPSPLPGMDQDDWAAHASANDRQLDKLLDEFEALRQSHVAMYQGFSGEELERSGVASGCRFTVRSLAFILAGHEIHHRRVLDRLYLPALEGSS